MRLPMRRRPVTVRPVAASSGGSTDLSRNGVASLTRSIVFPTMRGRNAKRYSSTSGSSGTAQTFAAGAGRPVALP